MICRPHAPTGPRSRGAAGWRDAMSTWAASRPRRGAHRCRRARRGPGALRRHCLDERGGGHRALCGRSCAAGADRSGPAPVFDGLRALRWGQPATSAADDASATTYGQAGSAFLRQGVRCLGCDSLERQRCSTSAWSGAAFWRGRHRPSYRPGTLSRRHLPGMLGQRLPPGRQDAGRRAGERCRPAGSLCRSRPSRRGALTISSSTIMCWSMSIATIRRSPACCMAPSGPAGGAQLFHSLHGRRLSRASARRGAAMERSDEHAQIARARAVDRAVRIFSPAISPRTLGAALPFRRTTMPPAPFLPSA